MSENTPEQRAYEAYAARIADLRAQYAGIDFPSAAPQPWDRLSDDYHSGWEAAVQAVVDADGSRALLVKIDAVMLTEGKTHQWKVQQVLELLGVFSPSGPSRLAGAIAAAQQPAKRVPELGAVAYEAAETGVLREQLAVADRATAEFRRQCSELAGELGAARAVVREIRTHLADAGLEVDEELQDAWWESAGIGDGK